MDRIRLSTKALLGMATRTVDQEQVSRHEATKTMLTAVGQFEAAIEKMAASIEDFGASMEAVAKAFREVALHEQQGPVADAVRDAMAALDGVRTTLLMQCHSELKDVVGPMLAPLRSEHDLCERLYVERARGVDAYDYHRDLVEKKEFQYALKGKSLVDSMSYKEAVNRRDSAKADYIVKHEEYSSAFNAQMLRKSELTVESLRGYLECLLSFSVELGVVLSEHLNVVKDVVIQPYRYESTNVSMLDGNGGYGAGHRRGTYSSPQGTAAVPRASGDSTNLAELHMGLREEAGVIFPGLRSVAEAHGDRGSVRTRARCSGSDDSARDNHSADDDDDDSPPPSPPPQGP